MWVTALLLSNAYNYVYIAKKRLTYVCMSSLTQGHYSPLHFATKNGYSEVVDILLKHGAEPDVFDGVRSKVYTTQYVAVRHLLYGAIHGHY